MRVQSIHFLNLQQIGLRAYFNRSHMQRSDYDGDLNNRSSMCETILTTMWCILKTSWEWFQECLLQEHGKIIAGELIDVVEHSGFVVISI